MPKEVDLVKDPDSSSDVKKEENAEDMSLSDLLGGGDDSSSDEPKRVDHRADEPDSGMVNLAKMVADSSVEVARTPSIMPPPMEGGANGTAQDPSGVVQTQTGIQAPAQGEKKSQGPIFALIAVVIIAAVAIGYFATRNGDDDGIKAALEAERKANQDAMAQMMAKLAEMDKNKGSADETASKEMEEKMAALKAELEAAQKKDEDLAAKEAEAAAQKEKEEAETKAKVDKPKKTTTKPKKVDTTPKTVTPKKKTEKKAPTKKTGTSELDSLLSGPKKEKDKPKTAPADDMAKKPTKAEVKKAMGPVQARAQKSCAKYSTGTVQVQVVVAGKTGRVKSASPKGAFAGNQAGKCVAMMSRSAKFPKFADSTFSFTYPIILK